MVVFSNQLLGPAAELLVSPVVATAILRQTASAARESANARWELELVSWLEDRSRTEAVAIDVGDIAWTPEHFERQRRFVTDAIELAAAASEHARALALWRQMILAHPRDSVVVGRRWQWRATRQVSDTIV